MGHMRIKTEVDEIAHKPKVSYQGLMNMPDTSYKSKQPIINLNETKRSERNYHHQRIPSQQGGEQKNKTTIKKLRLNHELRKFI